jgi:hypothetical protein
MVHWRVLLHYGQFHLHSITFEPRPFLKSQGPKMVHTSEPTPLGVKMNLLFEQYFKFV